MIIPYIGKWPQALAIMSLPPNVPPALANLLTLVDDICYYAGDRSVDVSYSNFNMRHSRLHTTHDYQAAINLFLVTRIHL
jgi:hypothetical protein